MPRLAQDGHLRPTSTQIFEVNEQRYVIYKFAEGHGPTLSEAIDFAKGKGEMLNIEDCGVIRFDPNATFKTTLRPGDWSYFRYQESEKQSAAAFLEYWDGEGLIYGHGGADTASPLLILKENPKDAHTKSVKVSDLAELERTSDNAERLMSPNLDPMTKRVFTELIAASRRITGY